MSPMQERLKNVGMTQVEMIMKLRERGIVVHPPEMSYVLRGIVVYPKAKKILEECENILAEQERGYAN